MMNADMSVGGGITYNLFLKTDFSYSLFLFFLEL